MDQLEQKNTTAVEHEYGASEIQVLEGLEAVRKRPGMYIGSTSSSGLHHLVYEIVDNAIDEALAGYCTEIQVGIEPGNIIRVVDNGRGIPVDIQKQTGKPALEVVFTILHAGGKFGGGGYKVSGGLHGVGASVVNALSQWLEVRVHKDGQIYEMKFARGQVTQPMQVVGQTDRTGTEVVFQPDPEMFTETTEYDYETLHTRMREEAFLNAGLSITIADRRGEEVISETMCYEGGIREFVTYINRNKTPIHDGVIYMAGSREDAMAEVSLQYNDSYNEIIVSFANNVHTPEGGMHEEGFKYRVLLRRTWNEPHFNHRFDGVVYGVFVSLGFAAVENVLYVLTSGFSTAVVRAIFSIPGHAMFGVVMGEAMSRAKWLEVHGQREQAGAARRRAWLLPAVLHGLYDFLLVGFGWIFYGYFAGLVVYVVRLLRQSAREDGPINL